MKASRMADIRWLFTPEDSTWPNEPEPILMVSCWAATVQPLSFTKALVWIVVSIMIGLILGTCLN